MSDSHEKEGLVARIVAAVRRRLPRLKRFVVFSGAATDEFAGAMRRKGIELAEIDLNNVERALDFRSTDVVEQLRTWLERGARGWFAVRNGDVLGYAFIASANGKSRTVRHLRLHPGEAAGILFYTRRRFRKTGVGPAFLQEILARAAAIDGIDRVVVWTVPAKQRWARALARYGLDFESSVLILEVGGRSILRMTKGSSVTR